MFHHSDSHHCSGVVHDIKLSISSVLIFSFSGVPSFLKYLFVKLHLYTCKTIILLFSSLNYFYHPFISVFPKRFFMAVLQGCNSFSMGSSRFLLENLKCSFSCISSPIHSLLFLYGVIAFWIHEESWRKFIKNELFKPIIPFSELSRHGFHLRNFLMIVAIMVL